MASIIAECRYLAESLSAQYGVTHRNFTGDGHLFLFEFADAAVQFGLRLVQEWARPDSPSSLHIPMRVGCHFGECVQMDDGLAWIGRGINLAKRVEDEAEGDTVFISETLLELLDLPLYEFEPAGTRELKGDHLPQRSLYRVMRFIESVLQEKPKAEMTADQWFLRGVTYIGTGDEDGAEEARCYREALLLRPDYPEAHNNLAVLLRASGSMDSAVHHYREALRLRPDYPEANYNYGLLLDAGGQHQPAIEHLEFALQSRPDYVDAHHSMANLLLRLGDTERAERHYHEALRLRPEYAEALNNYAILLEDRGETDKALALYEECLAIRPDYAEAHYNLALLLENTGDSDGAEKHYREAVRLRPDYPEARNNLAVLLHGRGEFTEAERQYQEVLRLRSEDPEAHYNYGLLLKDTGRPDLAISHFRTAVELAPDVSAFRGSLEAALRDTATE
jgi:Tfp pilus assembly protein PilF